MTEKMFLHLNFHYTMFMTNIHTSSSLNKIYVLKFIIFKNEHKHSSNSLPSMDMDECHTYLAESII